MKNKLIIMIIIIIIIIITIIIIIMKTNEGKQKIYQEGREESAFT